MKKLLAIISALITGGLVFAVANSVQIALAGRELN
jgi:cell division protein FtsX